MIKYFCDSCGKGLANEDTILSKDFLSPSFSATTRGWRIDVAVCRLASGDGDLCGVCLQSLLVEAIDEQLPYHQRSNKRRRMGS